MSATVKYILITLALIVVVYFGYKWYQKNKKPQAPIQGSNTKPIGAGEPLVAGSTISAKLGASGELYHPVTGQALVSNLTNGLNQDNITAPTPSTSSLKPENRTVAVPVGEVATVVVDLKTKQPIVSDLTNGTLPDLPTI